MTGQTKDHTQEINILLLCNLSSPRAATLKKDELYKAGIIFNREVKR